MALIDPSLCQIPGADFKMVTSYVLGEKPEVNKPNPDHTLLNFEVCRCLLLHCAQIVSFAVPSVEFDTVLCQASDEIEDLDGFEEHMDRLSFMVYNVRRTRMLCCISLSSMSALRCIALHCVSDCRSKLICVLGVQEAEDKPACNLHNFWALEPMMTNYDDMHGHAADSKKCVSHRVPKANCIEHEVTDWVKLQTDARAKADE